MFLFMNLKLYTLNIILLVPMLCIYCFSYFYHQKITGPRGKQMGEMNKKNYSYPVLLLLVGQFHNIISKIE